MGGWKSTSLGYSKKRFTQKSLSSSFFRLQFQNRVSNTILDSGTDFFWVWFMGLQDPCGGFEFLVIKHFWYAWLYNQCIVHCTVHRNLSPYNISDWSIMVKFRKHLAVRSVTFQNIQIGKSASKEKLLTKLLGECGKISNILWISQTLSLDSGNKTLDIFSWFCYP